MQLRPTLLIAVGAAGVLASLGCALTTPAKQNVPTWLHVTETDLTTATREIQAAVVLCIVCSGAQAVVMALQRRIGSAVASLIMLVATSAAAVLCLPSMLLGSRSTHVQMPTGSYFIDPVPYRTDFDYRTYLPDLVSAVTVPALCALAAAVCLGITLASSAHLWQRTQVKPSARDK